MPGHRHFGPAGDFVARSSASLPLPGDGASALFQVINQRYLKSSTILTANVGIADWATVFGD
ncbi:ATP-binding protein [Saccharopolyspora shandongensis]|uniref:ATP-binding protein n=1 Tax=Saccharopolyspora shandongensis TaxID=418495 RepID=UPI0033ED510A